ncbi:MAG: hypothetical protein H6740_21690 [Alphaproteobacteria bacterium]|nr:hypothetical protein [Alphaproteobacteria bacterium]
MLHLLLLACTGSPDSKVDKIDDSAPELVESGGSDSAPADDSSPVELTGEVPEAPFPAPEFTATNHLGAPRSRDDLIGHPTVMWFFPAAGTFG